jgi:hypothetical protein
MKPYKRVPTQPLSASQIAETDKDLQRIDGIISFLDQQLLNLRRKERADRQKRTKRKRS